MPFASRFMESPFYVKVIDMDKVNASIVSSGRKPLRVEGDIMTEEGISGDLRAAWKRVLMEASRIQSLSVDYDWGGTDRGGDLVGPDGFAFPSTLRQLTFGRPQLLALEHLTLCYIDDHVGEYHVPPFIHYSNLPSLKSLTTTRISLRSLNNIPFEPLMLTRLEMTDCLDGRPDDSFGRLMRLLARLSNLKELALVRALTDREVEAARHATQLAPVQLPHLSFLLFVGNVSARNAAYFLDSLVYPPDATLEVGACLQDPSNADNNREEQELTTLRQTILQKLPNGVPCGGLFVRRHGDRRTTVSASKRPFQWNDCVFNLSVHASALHLDFDGYSPQAISKFLIASHLLSSIGIEILAVETMVADPTNPTPDPWLESAAEWHFTFGALQRVHTIRVSGRASLHFPSALFPVGNVALFPALEDILFNGFAEAERYQSWRAFFHAVLGRRSELRVAEPIQRVVAPLKKWYEEDVSDLSTTFNAPDEEVDMTPTRYVEEDDSDIETDYEDTDEDIDMAIDG